MPRSAKRKAEAQDEEISRKEPKFDPVQAANERRRAVEWAAAVLQSPAAKKKETPAKKTPKGKARVSTPELPSKVASPPKDKASSGSVYERALIKEAAANAAAAAAAAAPIIASKPQPTAAAPTKKANAKETVSPAPVKPAAPAKGSSVYERALAKEKGSPPATSLHKTSTKPVASSPVVQVQVAAKGSTKGSLGRTLLSAFILLSGLSLVLVLVGSKGQPFYLTNGLALVSGLAYLFAQKR